MALTFNLIASMCAQRVYNLFGFLGGPESKPATPLTRTSWYNQFHNSRGVESSLLSISAQFNEWHEKKTVCSSMFIFNLFNVHWTRHARTFPRWFPSTTFWHPQRRRVWLASEIQNLKARKTETGHKKFSITVTWEGTETGRGHRHRQSINLV